MKQMIELIGAPPALSPGGYVPKAYGDRVHASTPKAAVELLKKKQGWQVNISWPCPNPVTDISDQTDVFADSAAILVPQHEQSNYFSMGSPEAPVEAAFWRGDKEAVVHIHAEGLGSVERGDAPESWQFKSRWSDGYWHLEGTFPDWPALDTFENIAIAIWRGEDNERGGLKSISPSWIGVE